MKTTFYIFFLIIAAFPLLLSCNLQGTNPVVAHRSLALSGRVLSIEDYSGVANATVAVGAVTTMSGADGSFSISAADVTDNDLLRISCPGYVALRKSLVNFPGTALTVEFTLKPVDVTIIIDPARPGGNTVTTPDNASVFIPALSDVNEPLSVSVTSIDVGTEELACAPGDFRARDAGNNAATLISMGMVDVSIQGVTTGDTYALSGVPCLITIPISGDLNAAPDIIPLWYFDESSGLWREEGSLQKSGQNDDLYTGPVSHFTTWNADYSAGPVTSVYGVIVDPDAGGETYQVTLTATGFTTRYLVDDDEFYINRVPQNKFMEVTVQKMSTGGVWKRFFYSSNGAGCVHVGSFPGPNDFPEVTGLRTILNDNDVTVSWTGEPASCDGVLIAYYPTGSTVTQSVSVAKGEMTAQLADLPPGSYTIVTRTYTVSGEESCGLTRRVRVGDSFTLSISTTPGYPILYAYNGSTGFGFWPELVAIVPRKTTVMLDIDVPQQAKNQCFWVCNGVTSFSFPVTYSVEDDLTITLYVC